MLCHCLLVCVSPLLGLVPEVRVCGAPAHEKMAAEPKQSLNSVLMTRLMQVFLQKARMKEKTDRDITNKTHFYMHLCVGCNVNKRD